MQALPVQLMQVDLQVFRICLDFKVLRLVIKLFHLRLKISLIVVAKDTSTGKPFFAREIFVHLEPGGVFFRGNDNLVAVGQRFERRSMSSRSASSK